MALLKMTREAFRAADTVSLHRDRHQQKVRKQSETERLHVNTVSRRKLEGRLRLSHLHDCESVTQQEGKSWIPALSPVTCWANWTWA